MTGFTHSRNRLAAVEGKWYTKFCVSILQIFIIYSEKGKFLEVFEIRGFFTVCIGGTRLRPNLQIDMRHDFLAWFSCYSSSSIFNPGVSSASQLKSPSRFIIYLG